MWHLIRTTTIVALLVATAGLAVAARVRPASSERWAVVARLPIGGTDTGYDYLHVDEAAQRLYVAHGTRVEVLELPTGKKLGEVAGTHGVHGVETLATLGKGYTSDGQDRTVTVFDLKTLRVLGKIQPTGVKPDAIQYDPQSQRLYAVNGGSSGNVTVIDPVTDQIVATLELSGGKLEEISFDGKGRGFVNDEGKSLIQVFDTQALRKLAEWPLAPCQEPTGLAIDTQRHRLYSVCSNRTMVVVDSDSGRIVAKVPIGSGPDGIAYDAKRGLLFVSNYDGTLDVIRAHSADRYERTQIVKTGPGARTIALDHGSARIYVPTVQLGVAPPGGGRVPMVPESFAVLAIGLH